MVAILEGIGVNNMQVQRISNNKYNLNFGNRGQLACNTTKREIEAIKKVLNFIQKNMELSDFNTRSEMQAILHNTSIKEGIPDELKQQAKELLLKSYM